MKIKVIKLIAVLGYLLFLTGCGTSLFVHPVENPIIEDKVGYSTSEELGTLATTAQRRIVLVKLRGDNPGRFCAEPSPDASDNLASTLSAVITAQIKKNGVSGEARAGFDKTLATTVEKLGVRSQGVQFFRDGMYNLCQSFLNGAISGSELNATYSVLMKTSADLIKTEIKYKDSVVSAPAVQLKTTEQLAEAANNLKIALLKNRKLAEAEKIKQAAISFTAKANLDASRATAAFNKIQAENKLLAEQRKEELENLKAKNILQAEKDRAELELKEAAINKAKKDRQLNELLKNDADNKNMKAPVSQLPS